MLFVRLTCKICGTIRREERHPLRQDAASCSHRHWDHRRSNAHTRKTHCVHRGTYIDSAPREIFNAVEATCSAPSNRNEELADRVSRETRRSRSNKSIVRQERCWNKSHVGSYDQSMIVQLFLDCVDRATAS